MNSVTFFFKTEHGAIFGDYSCYDVTTYWQLQALEWAEGATSSPLIQRSQEINRQLGNHSAKASKDQCIRTTTVTDKETRGSEGSNV